MSEYHSQTGKFIASITQNMPLFIKGEDMQYWIEHPTEVRAKLASAFIRLSPWKVVTINSGLGSFGETAVDRLLEVGYSFKRRSEEVFRRMESLPDIPTPLGMKLEFYKLRPCEMGLSTSVVKVDEINDWAQNALGLELCTRLDLTLLLMSGDRTTFNQVQFWVAMKSVPLKEYEEAVGPRALGFQHYTDEELKRFIDRARSGSDSGWTLVTYGAYENDGSMPMLYVKRK